jgi:hypothetical protein
MRKNTACKRKIYAFGRCSIVKTKSNIMKRWVREQFNLEAPSCDGYQKFMRKKSGSGDAGGRLRLTQVIVEFGIGPCRDGFPESVRSARQYRVNLKKHIVIAAGYAKAGPDRMMAVWDMITGKGQGRGARGLLEEKRGEAEICAAMHSFINAFHKRHLSIRGELGRDFSGPIFLPFWFYGG